MPIILLIVEIWRTSVPWFFVSLIGKFFHVKLLVFFNLLEFLCYCYCFLTDSHKEGETLVLHICGGFGLSKLF